MWLLLACSLPKEPRSPVDSDLAADTAADTGADSGADSASEDTAEDSGEEDSAVETGDPPDTGLWPEIPCDTAELDAPRVGVDTGGCPSSAELDAALAAIPDPDDPSCPWAAPVDTGVGVATGCPAVPEEDAPPTVDEGCVWRRTFYGGEPRYEQIFDAAGRNLLFRSEDGGTRYRYDVHGNLVWTDSVRGGSARRTEENEYLYDADGRVLEMAVYEYGVLDERITYSYDDVGRLATACSDRPYTESYTWTDDGLLASYGYDGADPDTTDGGGWFTYVHAYTYDEQGRPSAEFVNWIYDSWGFNDDRALAWTYDADGNRRREYLAEECGPWTVEETRTITYATDCSATVTSDLRDQVLVYDAEGRLVEEDWGSWGYTWMYSEGECPC